MKYKKGKGSKYCTVHHRVHTTEDEARALAPVSLDNNIRRKVSAVLTDAVGQCMTAAFDKFLKDTKMVERASSSSTSFSKEEDFRPLGEFIALLVDAVLVNPSENSHFKNLNVDGIASVLSQKIGCDWAKRVKRCQNEMAFDRFQRLKTEAMEAKADFQREAEVHPCARALGNPNFDLATTI